MAFANKVGNMIKRTVTSNPSIYQTIRCMSSSKLFVGGLSYSTDDQSLREAFTSYGEVTEARVIMDRETGRSRGFGFITFTSSEEASAALSGMDGKDLHGRIVRVNYANERRSGYGGGSGGYGGGGYGAGGYGAYGGVGGGYAAGGSAYGGNSYNRGDGNYSGDSYSTNGGSYGGGNNYSSGPAGYGGHDSTIGGNYALAGGDRHSNNYVGDVAGHSYGSGSSSSGYGGSRTMGCDSGSNQYNSNMSSSRDGGYDDSNQDLSSNYEEFDEPDGHATKQG